MLIALGVSAVICGIILSVFILALIIYCIIPWAAMEETVRAKVIAAAVITISVWLWLAGMVYFFEKVKQC